MDGTTVTYTYDDFGRLSNQVTKQGETTVLSEPYMYVSPATGVTSTQVYRYRTTTATGNSTWYYSYDQNGNITYVDSSAFGDVSYQYDSQGQLLWEYSNVTYYATQWEYDDAGNILSRKVYDYYFDEIDSLYRSDTYSYTDTQWGDLLTGYNGRTLRYDGIGNLTNDGIWTYAWQHGRQLASMTSGSTTWEYTYNADGLRTQKTDGNNTYTYIYNGSKLTAMTKGSDTLYFTYDAVGTPLTVTYNGTVYYYGTNLQGDIAQIFNAAGTMVVGYRYNAYGELDSMFGSMADTLGILNPLRYRGYVYDTETELYYLQSRYYNPEWGRFINEDVCVFVSREVLDKNTYNYCQNDPINGFDPCGECEHRLDFWNNCENCEFTLNQFARGLKVAKVFNAYADSVSISAGIGLGMELSGNIGNLISLGIGVLYNQLELNIDDGELSLDQSCFIGFESAVAGYSYSGDAGEGYHRPLEFPTPDWTRDELDDDCTLISFSSYFIIGFSFEISFDFTDFLNEIEKINLFG